METTSTADRSLRELLLERVWFDDDPLLTTTARQLAAADPTVDGSGTATGALLEALTLTWERGWQPADVAHVVRRDASPRGARLAVGLVTEEARLTSAMTRAPAEWVEQLHALGASPGGTPGGVHAWHRAEKRSPVEAWRVVLLVAGRLRLLFPIPQLLPPPSRWSAAPSSPSRDQRGAPRPAADQRVLRRVRGLLAKAESTEFPEEADALTAKAQELMSAHALDAAVLEAGAPAAPRDGVRSRRLHVDEPYLEAKMTLLARVGEANGVRTVWYRGTGIATVVGMPVDLETTELLFTSLLVQAGRAMNVAAAAGGAHARSAAFRRSFLRSFGWRIGERLIAARSNATTEAAETAGVDLLPVLRSRQRAVDEVYEELFPSATSRRSRAFDAAGWAAGHRAADSADLSSRRGRLPQ
jgi:hypothetical protein